MHHKKEESDWKSSSYYDRNLSYPKCIEACYSRHAIEENFLKTIIESDLLIPSYVINRKSIPQRQISNLIEGINMLTKDMKNVKFVYYRRSTNDLTDRIVKKTT